MGGTSKVLLILAVPLLTFAGELAAQQPDSIVAGDKIRLTTSASRRLLVGVLEHMDTHALTLRQGVEGSLVTLPLDSIDRLEVLRGERSKAREGALGGALVGGFLMGVSFDCPRGSDPGLCNLAHVIVTVGAAGLGALFGLMIGSALTEERWVSVPLEGVAVGLTPRDGLWVSVAVRAPSRHRSAGK